MKNITHIVVLVTCKDYSEAQHISATLINARLVACTNIISNVQSVFRWQGAVEEGIEVLLIAKTQHRHFEQLAQLVKNEHSYDTPEIIALPIIAGSKDYLSWITEETDPG